MTDDAKSVTVMGHVFRVFNWDPNGTWECACGCRVSAHTHMDPPRLLEGPPHHHGEPEHLKIGLIVYFKHCLGPL
jgi:hypothetical protein